GASAGAGGFRPRPAPYGRTGAGPVGPVPGRARKGLTAGAGTPGRPRPGQSLLSPSAGAIRATRRAGSRVAASPISTAAASTSARPAQGSATTRGAVSPMTAFTPNSP